MVLGCSCFEDVSSSSIQAPRTPGHMVFCWGDVPNNRCLEYWHALPGYCNPMNCRNSACTKKGCANARAIYCQRHGKYCASLGKIICYNDTCPPKPSPGGGNTTPPPKPTPSPATKIPIIDDIADIVQKTLGFPDRTTAYGLMGIVMVFGIILLIPGRR